MKRMLLSTTAALAAAVAFSAAPAQAQDVGLYLDDDVTCNEPYVECARDLAIWGVNYAYSWVIAGGNIVDDVCDRTIGTCNL